MDDPRGGIGLFHRPGVGQTDILRGQDAEPSGNEKWVGPSFDQPGEPVKSRVDVRIPDRLDQRRGIGS
jgi:hypothetical protein